MLPSVCPRGEEMAVGSWNQEKASPGSEMTEISIRRRRGVIVNYKGAIALKWRVESETILSSLSARSKITAKKFYNNFAYLETNVSYSIIAVI